MTNHRNKSRPSRSGEASGKTGVISSTEVLRNTDAISKEAAAHSVTKHKAAATARAHELFNNLAMETARLSGKPITFLLAVGIVIVWAISGPLFNYSDTWQLVINTGTTIVTFLMVFLIQNTQNRDTLALQIKLAELIFVMRGAQNELAIAEDLSDEDLERLHNEYRERAEQAAASLSKRKQGFGPD